VSRTYQDYLSKVTKVKITPQNVKDFVLSIITYESNDNPESKLHKQRKGILLRVKVTSGDILLFIRVLQGKQPVKDRMEWLSLQGIRAFGDLQLGQVSVKFLQELENFGINAPRITLDDVQFASDAPVREELMRNASIKTEAKE